MRERHLEGAVGRTLTDKRRALRLLTKVWGRDGVVVSDLAISRTLERRVTLERQVTGIWKFEHNATLARLCNLYHCVRDQHRLHANNYLWPPPALRRTPRNINKSVCHHSNGRYFKTATCKCDFL